MHKPHVGRPRRRLLPLAVLALGVLATGCSGARSTTDASPPAGGRSSGPPPATTRVCRQPPAAAVPGAAGALSETDTGTFCLGVGQQIDVFLTAPGGRKPGVQPWHRVATSDARVLAPRSSGVLTAPVGVTPGIFQALAPGTVELSSTLPGDSHTWRVTIAIS